jgi:DNA-binding transcriptional LysR family regulator
MQRGALPPLSTLEAFEAAGRLMSFTRAAAELNVTQAAVSKQIQALERHVGQRLFERSHRAVQLTAQGREYLHTVVTALNHLSHATLELRSDEAPQRLCIAADHSVAALWLLPRMKSLQASHPDVTFHLVVSDAETRSLADEVDVAILHGENRWPLHQAEPLFPEIVFPVCSPDYLAGSAPIRHMADLAAARLIDLEDDNWTWINWRIWLTNHGVGLPATHKALTIGNYPLVLEAARRGLGIALAWQSLIEADLASGSLVRPIDAEVSTRFSYYLAWPRTRQRSAVALAFCTWVQEQFGQSNG